MARQTGLACRFPLYRIRGRGGGGVASCKLKWPGIIYAKALARAAGSYVGAQDKEVANKNSCKLQGARIRDCDWTVSRGTDGNGMETPTDPGTQAGTTKTLCAAPGFQLRLGLHQLSSCTASWSSLRHLGPREECLASAGPSR